jgi:hypothetical protein
MAAFVETQIIDLARESSVIFCERGDESSDAKLGVS